MELIERLSASNGSSSTRKITELEDQIYFLLPDDYKSFLLQANGGLYLPAIRYPINRNGVYQADDLKWLYGVDTKNSHCLAKMFREQHIKDKILPDYVIAIGSNGGFNCICMHLNNKAFGKIVEVDLRTAMAGIYAPTIIASSFSEFSRVVDEFRILSGQKL